MSSLCDRCFQPGACCKDLYLWGPSVPGAPAGAPVHFPLDTWREDAARWIADTQKLLYTKMGQQLAFRADRVGGIWWSDEFKCWYANIRWTCDALQPNGRCGIYDKRPDTCRVFEPASDSLCIHYEPQEGSTEGGYWKKGKK